MIDLTDWVDRIWEVDRELQESCLRAFPSDIRHVLNKKMADEDFEMLKRLKAFYIPDDFYLVGILGQEVTQYKYGIYRNGYCTISERLAIPLRTPNGRIIGLVGYSNTGVDSEVAEQDAYDTNNVDLATGNDTGFRCAQRATLDRVEETTRFSGSSSGDSGGSGDSGDSGWQDGNRADTTRQAELETSEEFHQAQTVIKYLYPPSYVFEKGRYLYCEPAWFRNAIQDGYICLTDGLFDTIRLNQNGINAASFCGSNLTNWHKLYLSFIPLKIIVGDNDNAGVKLVEKCKKELQGCVRYEFRHTKDIDDYLKNEENVARIKMEIFEMINSHIHQKRVEVRSSYTNSNGSKGGSVGDSVEGSGQPLLQSLRKQQSHEDLAKKESEWLQSSNLGNTVQVNGKKATEIIQREMKLRLFDYLEDCSASLGETETSKEPSKDSMSESKDIKGAKSGLFMQRMYKKGGDDNE